MPRFSTQIYLIASTVAGCAAAFIADAHSLFLKFSA
jgi:hypothetical protein